MKSYLVSVLLFSFMPTLAFSQTGPFCTAGIHSNGYVDLTGLPAAPNFPAGGGTSAPITVTLPVTSVPGLTVQVTIPALQSAYAGPVYSVTNGEVTFNGTPAAGYELMLQFSQPVAGVSAIGYSGGRGASFSLASSPLDPPPNYPVEFSNAASQYTLAPEFFSQALQQVDLNSAQGFTTAYVSASMGQLSFPSVANIRVQSGPAVYTSLVPVNGLQLWFNSDTIAPALAPNNTWPDSSGNGHVATYTGSGIGPSPVDTDGNYCKRAYSFGGSNYFNFNLPIAGWQQMTVFLVAKAAVNPPAGSYASNSAAILWNENAYWGNTFVSPYQTSEPFRFGTEQVNNQPIYTRPVTVGQDFTISRAVHSGTTDSLYVNGLLALRQSNKLAVLAGTAGDAYLGRGYNNTYYNGEISEVLVYNRTLSEQEAASVESYLRNKFGTQ